MVGMTDILGPRTRNGVSYNSRTRTGVSYTSRTRCELNSGLPGVTGEFRLCECFGWFRNLARWFSIGLSDHGFVVFLGSGSRTRETSESHPAPDDDYVRASPFLARH